MSGNSSDVVPVLSLAVLGRSSKENERRLPLHPDHLRRIPEGVRARLRLESGYGQALGSSDADLAEWVAGVAPREQLVAECDVVLLPKPVLQDVRELRPGQVLWGWPHCVQDSELTQAAIDRGLTLIAFEAMNHWDADGSFNLHVFHKNNELAGYCSVLHALQLLGRTGHFGRRLRAVVIGFGATARGAVTALNGLGVTEVDVLTRRESAAVAAPIHTVRMVHLEGGPERETSRAVVEEQSLDIAEFLSGHDLIVNCVLQDPKAPMMFLAESDLPVLAPGVLVVDVSCDQGMGFPWARPTTFTEPMFEVVPGVHHYGVDHSPSHLWQAATWENSEALLAFLGPVLAGPDGWDANPTIARAIEIREGVVQNPEILAFQHRAAAHPHPVLAG